MVYGATVKLNTMANIEKIKNLEENLLLLNRSISIIIQIARNRTIKYGIEKDFVILIIGLSSLRRYKICFLVFIAYTPENHSLKPMWLNAQSSETKIRNEIKLEMTAIVINFDNFTSF